MIKGAINSIGHRVAAALDPATSSSGMTKASVKAALVAADSALASNSETRINASLTELRNDAYSSAALKCITGNYKLSHAVGHRVHQLEHALKEIRNQKAVVASPPSPAARPGNPPAAVNVRNDGRLDCIRPDREEGSAGNRQRRNEMPREREIKPKPEPKPKPLPREGGFDIVVPPMRPRAGEVVQAIRLLENAQRYPATAEERQHVRDYLDAALVMRKSDGACRKAESAHDALIDRIYDELGEAGSELPGDQLREQYPEAKRAFEVMRMREGEYRSNVRTTEQAYKRLEATWLAQGYKIRPQSEETHQSHKVFGAT